MLADMLCDHAAAVEAVTFWVKKKKNLGHIMVHISLFAVFLSDWTSSTAVWFWRMCWRVPQVRRSPTWGQDALWKHTLRKKTKQLDCVFMNRYYRYKYEWPFSSLQILRSSCFRLLAFCPFFISAHFTVHSPHTVLKRLFNAYHTTEN